jgi:serine/threonine-protein kinase ULK/ATG1
VLKSCDNPNIIKLYDLKKTANNFYLILEYCNEGDLMVYLKQKKTLPEDEAVEYLVQILNAFKTLVKNKILHRDFKLANILKHDGEIKIADFGFAKLLTKEDYATTMLGSPLNMAPEVLGGNDYNNKADIWSIGTVFYELLFGKYFIFYAEHLIPQLTWLIS